MLSCKSLTIAAVVGFGALTGAAAHASVVDFTSGMSFEADGITVTVTTGVFDPIDGSDDAEVRDGNRVVSFGAAGLGSRRDGDPEDNRNVDGRGGNDLLIFTFSSDVILNSISFANLDSRDDFAFGTVVDSIFQRVVTTEEALATTQVSSFATLEQRSGTTFAIGALQSNDNFRVAGFDFTAIVADEPVQDDPAPVPLPATGLLLLGALGLGVASRRRSKSKA